MSTEQDEEIARLQTELNILSTAYSEFVYSVTHDLIGQFRQAEGFATIILSSHSDQVDDKAKRYLDRIISGSEKGNNILESLLSYSRLITADYSGVSVDCNIVVEEVKMELAPLIEHTGATITCLRAPTIVGDDAQIRLLFYHLIHNALHYQSPGSSPEITIESVDMGKQWQICVKDNGIGLRQKMAGKMFTALKRGVVDKEYCGIGMGLTIARTVVQRHGGDIWVTSEKDHGSSFYFTLGKET